MDWESSDVVRFDLQPLLQGQTRTAKLKSAYNLLIISPRGLQLKPTYRKSWAGNLLMWSDLTLLQGETSTAKLVTRLLLIPEVCNVKPTCRISWAGNLLMSHLTFSPTFKVKR